MPQTRRRRRKLVRITYGESLGVQSFEDEIAGTDPLGSGKSKFIFNYKNVQFVSIDAHVHALILYNQLAASGCSVTLEWPDGKARSYAERMSFFARLDSRIEVVPDCFRGDIAQIYNNRTLLELTELDANDHASCESCVELVRERAGAAIDNARVTNEFTTVAAEVIGNIEEWSETRISGIAAIQRYSNRIAISIGDAGIGILGSLRKNVDLGDQSDNEVLGRVFTDGLSSRGTPGSGAGLKKCVAIAARYEGRLLIRTNRIWSKLIVNAKKGGRNWHIWSDDRALVPGTVLTFELLEERLKASSY